MFPHLLTAGGFDYSKRCVFTVFVISNKSFNYPNFDFPPFCIFFFPAVLSAYTMVMTDCLATLSLPYLHVSPYIAFVTSFASPYVECRRVLGATCVTLLPSSYTTRRRRRTISVLSSSSSSSSFSASSFFGHAEMRRRGKVLTSPTVRANAATVDSPLPVNPTDDDSSLGTSGPPASGSANADGVGSRDMTAKANSNDHENEFQNTDPNQHPNKLPKLISSSATTNHNNNNNNNNDNAIVGDQEGRTKNELPNKWVVACVASVIHALHATAVYMAPSTLLSPMRTSLNLSVAEITRPLIIYRLVQTVLLFPAGFLISDIGPQVCLRVAIITAAVLAPLLAFVQTLPQLIVLQSLFSITKLFGGLSPLLMVVTSAFPDGKGIGTATAIVLSGYSFAGFLAPAFIGSIAGCVGWRIATLILSLIFSFVSVPITLHYLRNRDPYPSLVDRWRTWRSRSVTSSSSTACTADLVATNSEPIFTAPYATIFVAVAAFSFSMNLVFDHLILFLGEDMKMPFHVATRYLSALNLISLGGKMATGPIADRFSITILLIICGICGAFSCLLLLDISLTTGIVTVTQSAGRAFAFVAMYSLFYSGTFNLTTAILPEFGRKKMAIRSNLNLVALFGAGSLGTWLAARWRSVQGSYKWPFIWNVFCFAIVALCALFKYFVFDRPAAAATKLSQSITTPAALPVVATNNNIKQD